MRALIIKYICLTAMLIALSSCGSDKNEASQSKLEITNSSSASAANQSDLEFIYPTNLANISGLISTKVIIESNDETIISIEVNGKYLEKRENAWVLDGSNKLNLDFIPQNKITDIPVLLTYSNGNTATTNISLSTLQSGQAGSEQVAYASGLAFNQLSGDLYFADSLNRKLYKFQYNDSSLLNIYETKTPIISTRTLEWSIDIDDVNDEIYLLAENIDANSNKFISLVKANNSNSFQEYEDEDSRVMSAKSAILDLQGTNPLSLESPTLFFIDYENDQSVIGRWFLGEIGVNQGKPFEARVNGPAFHEGFKPQSIALVEGSLYVLRQSNPDNLSDSGALLSISTELTPDGLVSDSKVVAEFNNYHSEILKPTSLLPVKLDKFYLAANESIWLLDLASEQASLISSSSFTSTKKGQGPRLGSSITSMELHPEHDVLYIAAGAQGIMAVDLETGDRITVAK